MTNSTTNTLQQKSNGDELSEELSAKSMHNIGENKKEAPIESIELVDKDTIRIWTRVIGDGRLSVSEMERPYTWNPRESLFIRIADYYGAEMPEQIPELETYPPTTVAIQKTEKEITDEQLDSLHTSAEELGLVSTVDSKNKEGSQSPKDVLALTETDDEYIYKTWECVDPKETAGEDVYGESDDRSTDEPLFSVANATVTAGFVSFVAGFIGTAMLNLTMGSLIKSVLTITTIVLLTCIVLSIPVTKIEDNDKTSY